MIFKKFLFYFQKICIFFNYKKLKEKMSRKISKFYVISFIMARVIFFKKSLTPRVMKMHIQILHIEGKLEGRI